MSVALKEEVNICVTDTEAVNANLVEARWKCGVYQDNFLVARSNVESHTSAQEQVKRARRPRLRRTCDRIMRRTISIGSFVKSAKQFRQPVEIKMETRVIYPGKDLDRLVLRPIERQSK